MVVCVIILASINKKTWCWCIVAQWAVVDCKQVGSPEEMNYFDFLAVINQNETLSSAKMSVMY